MANINIRIIYIYLFRYTYILEDDYELMLLNKYVILYTVILDFFLAL